MGWYVFTFKNLGRYTTRLLATPIENVRDLKYMIHGPESIGRTLFDLELLVSSFAGCSKTS